MRGLVVLVLSLAFAFPVPALAQAAPPPPEHGPELVPSVVVPPPVPPLFPPPNFVLQPPLQGVMAVIRPSPTQWISFARIMVKNVRLLSTDVAEIAALRLEVVGQFFGDQIDPKLQDEKLDAIGARIVKVAHGIVDSICEFREALTPQQRETMLSHVCIRLLNRPVRRPERVERVIERVRGRMPMIRGAASQLGLSLEQRARLKKLALHVAPALVRAGGEVLGHVLASVEELLNDNPSKENLHASADAAAKKVVEILKTLTATAREAKAVLTPAQIEVLVATFPAKLLFGGPMARPR